jgi:hypothetical protein
MSDLAQQIKDFENLRKLSKDEFDTRIQTLEQAKISVARAQSFGDETEIAVQEQNLQATQTEVDSLREQITGFDRDINDLQRQDDIANNINRDEDAAVDKYRNAQVVGDPSTNLDNAQESLVGNVGNEVNFGAEPKTSTPATINYKPLNNTDKVKDLRVKLRIPSNYLVSATSASVEDTPELNFGVRSASPKNAKYDKIRENGGIIFPYTPNILFNYSVAYSKQNPIHSNYALNFYKNSEIGTITLQARFTVQNNADAEMYIASTQLLYLMTKMRFGDDPLAGLPPPVCRLDAYGTYILTNVPVSVATVTVEYPENVDYFIYEPVYSPEDKSALPTVSQLTLTLIPMYSRQEMQMASVDSFINNFENQKKKGYL